MGSYFQKFQIEVNEKNGFEKTKRRLVFEEMWKSYLNGTNVGHPVCSVEEFMKFLRMEWDNSKYIDCNV